MDQNVGYQNLASQLQAIQSQADIYKGGSPLDASRHINNIATTLSKDYGVTKLSDIGVTLGVIPKFADTIVQERGKAPYRVQTYDVGPDGIPRWNQNSVARGFTPGQPVQQNMLDYKYYNKNTNQEIPANKFASEGEGEGYSNYNLQAVPDGKGGFAAIPVQEYSQSGFKEVATDLSPYVAVAALALQFVPGVGQAVGAAVLGGSAATAAATVGLTVSQITAAVGAATIAAGTTALQGGNAEDVLKAGLSAGAALGVNFAAGGGITGAAAGSVAGTAIKGGDASQVLTNAFAAGVGAGVQDVFGPAAGTIVRDLIVTGGVSDQTFLNAAAAEISGFNKPGNASAPIVEATGTPTLNSEINTQIQRLNLQQDLRDQLMNDGAFQQVSVLPVVAAGAQIAAEVGIPAIIRAAPVIAEYMGANMAREQIAAAIADVAGHAAALWYLNNLNNDSYFGQRFIPETGQTVTVNLPPLSEAEQSRLDKLYDQYQTTYAYIPTNDPNKLETVVITTKITPEQQLALSNPSTAEAAAANISATVTTVKPNGQTTTQPADTTSGVISVNNTVPVKSEASGGAGDRKSVV